MSERISEMAAALRGAIGMRDLAALEGALAAGADPNLPDRLGSALSSALMGVSETPRDDFGVEAARALIEAGAEVDPEEGARMGPLHAAAWSLDEASLRLLLSLGADAGARCDSGGTALHYLGGACASAHYAGLEQSERAVRLAERCARALLEAGCDWGALTDEGGSAEGSLRERGFGAVADGAVAWMEAKELAGMEGGIKPGGSGRGPKAL